MPAMQDLRTSCCLLAAFVLAGCGEPDSPTAAPGSVERATDAIDRDAAADRTATIDRLHDEENARAESATSRIAASEKRRTKQD